MWTRRQARRIGISGWVMNEPDGTVSAHAEGDDALIEEFITAWHRGPPGSSVDRVSLRDVTPEGFTEFNKR
jgi:acylphosphatase